MNKPANADDISIEMNIPENSFSWSEKSIRELLTDEEIEFAIQYMFHPGPTLYRLKLERQIRADKRNEAK